MNSWSTTSKSENAIDSVPKLQRTMLSANHNFTLFHVGAHDSDSLGLLC